MKKLLLLVCVSILMSGCLYSPYGYDGRGYSRGGDRGHEGGGERGHGDRDGGGERRGHGD